MSAHDSETAEKNVRVRRELWIAAGALLAGLVLLPLMIYAAGQLSLGPYQGSSSTGGLGAFLEDFYLGLVRGSAAVWGVVLGPYLFIGFLRWILLLSRRLRPASD